MIKFDGVSKFCIIASMNKEQREIVKQVKAAVTPGITQEELAKKLKMSRMTLHTRLKEGFTPIEVEQLRKLKIITDKPKPKS